MIAGFRIHQQYEPKIPFSVPQNRQESQAEKSKRRNSADADFNGESINPDLNEDNAISATKVPKNILPRISTKCFDSFWKQT